MVVPDGSAPPLFGYRPNALLLDEGTMLVRLAGYAPATSAMSMQRSPIELKARDWYPVSESNTVLSPCKSDAVPSGARSIVLVP